MSENEKTSWLVCLRAIGYTPSLISFRDRCSQCGNEVWRAASSPKNKILCTDCALQIMAKEKAILILPPDARQIRDLQLKDLRERINQKIQARLHEPP
jgi:DNA-directed RNA polymerase subunit RPC12/RpoP